MSISFALASGVKLIREASKAVGFTSLILFINYPYQR
jgi:hypothetical protein